MSLLSLLTDPNDELLRAALQAVGDVRPMANRLGDVPEILAHLAANMGFDVTIGGRVCMVQPVHARTPNGPGGRLIGMTIWVKTDPVPVSMSVSGRANRAIGTSPLDLGDRDFASAFRTYGFPADLVGEILDERTRTMLLDRFDGTRRSVRRDVCWFAAGRGRLMRFVPIPGSGFFRYRIAPNPAELRAEILETFAVADRLAYAWSRRYAEVAAREGPAGAAAWLAARQAETADYRHAKNRRSLVFVAVVLVVVFLIVAAIFAACVGFTVMHSDINGHPLLQR